MEIKMIGNKIAQARKKTNVSQAQLAERLFISPQAVGKWERGESIPDILTVSRLAEILQVDLNYFSENFKSATNEKLSAEPLAKLHTQVKEKTRGWNMSEGNWIDADFSGLKNLHEKFTSSNLKRCKFIDSDISGLLLKSNHVDGCDFRGSDISNCNFQNSHVVNNLFQDCSLQDTQFFGSSIQGCNFSGADFTKATIRTSSFQKNTIEGVVFNHANFTATAISDVVFKGLIENCSFENCSFSKVVFQNALITSTFFKSRNLKGIRFTDCQADRMTYEFLKNGKADLSGVMRLPE